MASTYTPRNRWELIGNGETGNEASWDLTINEQIGLIEDSVSGIAAITMTDANKTLSTANGGEDEARHAVIALSGGSLTATRDVICPAVEKLYVVSNATSGGQSIVFKTSAGTGITVPNGSKKLVYCDGTNVVDMVNDLPSGARLNGVAFGTAAVVADSSLAHLAGTETFTGAKTFANTGLLVQDTDASHALSLKWNENEASANRTLNIVMGGADRTLTLTDIASRSTAGALPATNTGLTIQDTDASHALTVKWNENSAAARTLNITGMGADRTLDMANVAYTNSNAIAWTGTAHSFSNGFGVNAQATQLGSAAGSATSPTNTNTNLLFFNNSSTNWGGMGCDTSGNFYITLGTSSPATKLFITVNGKQYGLGGATSGDFSSHSMFTALSDVTWHFGPSLNGGNAWGIYNTSTTGVYLSTGSTSWAASSDERLKTVTGDMGGALDRVCALEPIRYFTKADEFWAWFSGREPRQRTGISAQNALKVMPEVVDVPDGYDPSEKFDPAKDDLKTLGVRYVDIVPELIQAIKELRAEVAALRGGA